ncbi:MAG: septal ring lytic transglycosylase RlpA family protein, partial [Bacteroidota bacterium]
TKHAAMKVFMKIFLLNLLFATRLFSQAEEFGVASYYSDLFHGKPTASGELYDKDKLTCAHKTLPFGTIVKITRQDNKKSVEVKVNDRGPFISGRVVEISKAAAHRLDLVNDGSASVSVEVVKSAGESLASKPAEQPKEYQATQPAIKKETQPAPKKETTAEKTAAASDKPKETTKTKEAAAQSKQAAKPKETPKAASATSEKLTAKGGTEKKIPAKTAAAKTAAKTAAKLVKDQDYKQYDLYQIELRRPEKKGFGVQVAMLSSEDALLKKIAELQGDWFDNILVSVEQGKKKETQYKVILGPFDDEKSAQAYKASLKTKKKIDGFVINLADMNKDVKKN